MSGERVSRDPIFNHQLEVSALDVYTTQSVNRTARAFPTRGEIVWRLGVLLAFILALGAGYYAGLTTAQSKLVTVTFLS